VTSIRFDLEIVKGLPEGVYEGIATGVIRRPALWAPRKLAAWEREAGYEARRDWYAYYKIELYRAIAAEHHGALQAWLWNNGKRPVVTFPARYSCRKNSSTPLPIKGQSSNLANIIIPCRPGTTMIGADIDFNAPIGWGLRFRIGLKKERDWEGDPMPEWRRGLVVRKILAAFPAETLLSTVKHSAIGDWPEAVRSRQHTPGLHVQSRDFSVPTSVARNGRETPLASEHPSRQWVCKGASSEATAEVAADAGDATSADGTKLAAYLAQPPLSGEELEHQLRARYGSGWQQVATRGRCAQCEGPRYARDGEIAWCPTCYRGERIPR
jgi:hypothetical protein